MTRVQKTNNTVEVVADKLSLISGEAIPPSAEKTRRLFSFDGAPSTPYAAEKPGGFFSTTTPGEEGRNLPEAAGRRLDLQQTAMRVEVTDGQAATSPAISNPQTAPQ